MWFALLSNKDGPVVYFNNANTWASVWRELNYNTIVAFADALMVRPNVDRRLSAWTHAVLGPSSLGSMEP